ncbi:heparin-binding hemagglutinin [Nocardia veterana]|uniref:Heparin-binding hemagglutinin n=1 Tax=Nocardia veterana TaxID=132249 RepID=A0A7X6M2A6_9NOCA|nr:heparin-binding hemagglutinin [Nocardia veterana]NKY89019.1 heparin-binding hemagglutinin [Nocardia veterana]
MTQPNVTVTKPIYATVGAGDALYAAVNDIVDRVRDRAATVDVNARVEEARERLSNLPADVQDQIETLRGRLSGLPSELPDDLAELREKFTPEELRKLVDQYYRQLVDLYSDLAVRGEETVDRLRSNPGFDERFDKVEGIYSDVVTRAEDVLNKVSGQARGLLGKAADEAEQAAAVVDAEVVAVTTEATSEESAAPAKKAPAKKAPAKKAPAKPAAAKKTTPAKK